MYTHKLIDLKINHDKKYLRLLEKELKFIETLNFPLRKNYSISSIYKFLEECIVFTLLIDNNEVIGFSGLQHGKWQSNLARCGSHLWINPTFRSKNNKPSTWNSAFMMPYQLNKVEKTNNLDACFWSREYPADKNFIEMTNRSTENCPYGFIHEPLDDVYNVCQKINNECNLDKPCWQKVALIKFDPTFILELPKISFEEWNETYNV